jgi:hypothetical protein
MVTENRHNLDVFRPVLLGLALVFTFFGYAGGVELGELPVQAQRLTIEELAWTSCLTLGDQAGAAQYNGRLGLLKQHGFSEDLAKRYIDFANRVLADYRDFQGELPDKKPASLRLLKQRRDTMVRDRFSAFKAALDQSEESVVVKFLDEYLRARTARGKPAQ